jgi:putative hemolysin
LSVWLDLLFIFLLVLANGFFACSELAIISARKSKIAQLVSLGDNKALIVQNLQNDPHRFSNCSSWHDFGRIDCISSRRTVAVEFLKPTLLVAPFKFAKGCSCPIVVDDRCNSGFISVTRAWRTCSENAWSATC